jgi:superfamily I DNA/RNA helicase
MTLLRLIVGTKLRLRKVLANKVLELPAMETKLNLIGRGTDKGTGQTAILCRTNATVLQAVFTLLLDNKKVACVSKFKEMESQMYHVFAVLNEQVPKFPVASLKSFDTKDKMWQAIESNTELKQIYKLALMISDAKGGLFTGLKYLKDNLTSQAKADYIVSTVHSSKGLGFTNVVIADDFLPFKETQEEYDEVIADMEEDRVILSLLYVAITRAKEKVIFPWYLESWIRE